MKGWLASLNKFFLHYSFGLSPNFHTYNNERLKHAELRNNYTEDYDFRISRNDNQKIYYLEAFYEKQTILFSDC
uniref:Uncharacterized protein n=1 Tax=Romanomermis culicivorax TaxID=13658 RepID=A0A915KP46_ROMCU